VQTKYESLINDKIMVPIEAILEKSENFKSICSKNLAKNRGRFLPDFFEEGDFGM